MKEGSMGVEKKRMFVMMSLEDHVSQDRQSSCAITPLADSDSVSSRAKVFHRDHVLKVSVLLGSCYKALCLRNHRDCDTQLALC